MIEKIEMIINAIPALEGLPHTFHNDDLIRAIYLALSEVREGLIKATEETNDE